ncbi:MAG: squalene--hopene cyclase [Candidatus Ancaeobacter aquaticus]|nr:squalene--hopene cyclase [Candidatus Ancaeobacter aquaticus]
MKDIFLREKEYTLHAIKEVARKEPETTSLKDDSNEVRNAIDNARSYLLNRQDVRGFWIEELECDCTTTADYIILLNFLGWQEGQYKKKIKKAAVRIRELQQEDGSWNIFYKGPGEISATVKAYFALKLAGYNQNEPFMKKARDFILNKGGVERSNIFMKLYLALFGQYSWKGVPALPAELIFFKRFFVYEMSSWTRTIVIPLFIIGSYKPRVDLPEEKGIGELFDGKEFTNDVLISFDKKIFSWKNFFLVLDTIFKFFEKIHFVPLRKVAVKMCEKWIYEHLEGSAGLGAIWPSMVNAVMALKCLDYKEDDLIFIKAMTDIEDLVIEEKNTVRAQPCVSPVWDSAITLISLAESGLSPTSTPMQKGGKWILSKEIKKDGDWKVKNHQGNPGGWAFEFENEFYPDIDDSAMVLLALKRLDLEENEEAKTLAIERALSWILSMQNDDGGWAAFDKNNNKEILTNIPFADHNAMIDPSCNDITGRVLEALGDFGFTASDEPVKKAVNYLLKNQDKDGSWFGRWGVNYIYGTWAVITGMVNVGVCLDDSCIRKGIEWIKECQNQDGGWGESVISYDRIDLKGTGVSTASQTAWALLTLFSCGEYESAIVRSGIDYLLHSQHKDGMWLENEFTGTGFPKVYYLKYNSYKTNFPLLALSRYFYRR